MKLISLLALAALCLAAAPQGGPSACEAQGCKWNSGIVYSGGDYASSTTCSISSNDGACSCNGGNGGNLCGVSTNSCFVTVTYSFTYDTSNNGPASLSAGVMGCGSYDSASGTQSHHTPPPPPIGGVGGGFAHRSNVGIDLFTTVTVWAECSTCDFGCEQPLGG